jgi:drug/metabolite transporter (DMT)-like permease
MNRIPLAKILAAFSSLSAGSAIVATRFVILDTDPATMAVLRFGIGTLCLTPFLLVGFIRNPIAKADWPKVIFLGILFFGLFAFLFNAALTYTTAAHGAIGLATSPIITLVLAWMLGRENMTKPKIFCVILALLGVTVAVSDSLVENSVGKDLLFGDLLMLLAALTVSVYSIFAKPHIMKYGGIYFTSIIMAIGVFSLIVVSQLVGEPIQLPNFSPVNWWIVLFLGVVGGAMQFASYMWALGWISPSTAGISLTLAPISAFIFAWPILGEAISYQAIVGLILVVSAIVIMNKQPH